VEIITGLGRQDSYEQLICDSLRDNVKANFVYRNGMPTTRKCRFIDPAHLRKLFEIYYFDDRPLGGPLEQQFCNLIREKAPDFDVVVVADFGHGLITRKSIDALTETANFLAVNAQSNSANLGYNMITKYAKADYVCIDAPEARMASGDRFGELGDIVKHRLSRSVKSDRFVVTDGERGCVAFSSERGWSRIPAFTQQVVDTVGAGDAFLSITAPIAANGIDMDFVGLIGNAVGAMKVGTVGHRQSVEKIPLMKYITALLR
jgi:bifunctional ADP-heptose synthase (sugar kinase/adenylyltransferase)